MEQASSEFSTGVPALAAIPQLAGNSRQGLGPVASTMHWASGWVISSTSLGIKGSLYDGDAGPRSTGKERDYESGNDYFGKRYYASSMGRFMSPDDGSDQDPSDPQSWNLYGYVRNNPLTNTDPNGRECNVGADGSRTDGTAGGESCADVDRNNAQNPVASATVTATYDQDERIQMLANGIDSYTSRASLFDAAAHAYTWASMIDGAGELKGLFTGGMSLFSRKAAQTIEQATIDSVVASSESAASSQISQGARALAKKAGHAASGGFDSAFNGVAATKQNASALIRDIMSNPSNVVRGGKTVDVYNAAGQGVRFEAGTNKFIGFLEGSLRSR
jgi:RHS repeat-associated protein